MDWKRWRTGDCRMSSAWSMLLAPAAILMMLISSKSYSRPSAKRQPSLRLVWKKWEMRFARTVTLIRALASTMASVSITATSSLKPARMSFTTPMPISHRQCPFARVMPCYARSSVTMWVRERNSVHLPASKCPSLMLRPWPKTMTATMEAPLLVPSTTDLT